MKKTYTKIKIQKYSRYNQLLITITLFFGILLGRYFFYQDSSKNLIVGLVAGTIGGIILLLIDKNIRSSVNFEKGSKLEDRIVSTMQSIGYTCKQSIDTGNGDLDILAIKNNKYYGIESKNESGTITFLNGTLYLNNISKSHYIDRLLGNCKIVKNREFSTNPHVFIEPVIVFGYGATLVDIPKEGIKYGNINVKICTIKDFSIFLS